MAKKIGIKCKMYFGASLMTSANDAGVTAAAFAEYKKVQKVTLNRGTKEGDVTERDGDNELTAVVLKSQSVTIDMFYDEADEAGMHAVEDAYHAITPIAAAFMSSGIAAAGSRGVAANWSVTQCDRDEPSDGVVKLTVTLKPYEFVYEIKKPLDDGSSD